MVALEREVQELQGEAPSEEYIETRRLREQKRDDKISSKRQEKMQRELEEQKEEEDKLQAFNIKQREAYQKLKKAKKGKENQDEDDEEINAIAGELINKMINAVNADKDANEHSQPALQRLLMANEVYSLLRKIPVQERFLDQDGCQVLA